MQRRTFLQGTLPAAAGLAAAQPAAPRPNILWICTDQQRFNTITSLGNARIRTPNLDRLVKRGAAFTNNYCQNPICTPSRSSFLTGCYPSSLHVHRNGNAYFPRERTPHLISRILAKAGYDCGLVGKFHLSAADTKVETRLDDGYRLFEWSHHPRPMDFWPTEKHAYQRWLRDRGVSWDKAYKAKKVADCPAEYQPGIEGKHHEVTWCAEVAQAYLTGQLKAPWFISMHTFAPHPPFDPPPEYLERIDLGAMPAPLYKEEEARYQERFAKIDHQTKAAKPLASYGWRHLVAAYYAQIELIDAQVGRLLDALESSGQSDNTIVIFTSDHGEMLGDHGLVHKGCRFYEGAVHVPLLISWPGHFKEGLRSGALTELTDIVPTLLDAAHIPVPEHVEGKSLMKILTGQSPADRHREFVRAEYHDTLDMPNHTHATMLRDDRYKLVNYHGSGIGELFDLQDDPQEFRNLWDNPDFGKVRSRLVERLFDATMLATDLGQPRIGRF